MREYEGIFIFPPEGTPESRKKQEKIIEDAIQKFAGAVVQKTEWGKRPLGYEIQKFREGYFFLMEFKMDSLRMQECRKFLELQDELLKYMITLKTNKGPSAIQPKVSAPAAEKEKAVPVAHPPTGAAH